MEEAHASFWPNADSRVPTAKSNNLNQLLALWQHFANAHSRNARDFQSGD